MRGAGEARSKLYNEIQRRAPEPATKQCTKYESRTVKKRLGRYGKFVMAPFPHFLSRLPVYELDYFQIILANSVSNVTMVLFII